ncbi:ABC-type multidrug transport system, ATPase and permease component [Actinomyces denticolens]|uniref:ABC-type multidrug transport system, ATPase and permease component n=1 Tax=Actinomyces denticolens TaxID=52767 RepID=A0ABY1IC98_9ACTO|nr:ABC transporter ATP-binding protein [Actinomyces denticolens]SHI93030.1 ABC-type multidrug transport system, ATPase and permease component [Actinomyces denticolens]
MRFLPVPDAPLTAPPTHSTRAILVWLLRRAAAPFAVACAASIVANVIQAIVPAFLGAALDSGIEHGLTPRIWNLALGLLALFCVYAVGDTMLSYFSTLVRLRISFDIDRLVGRQVTTTGSTLGRQTSSGEVSSIVASDSDSIGTFFQRAVPVIGAAISFAVVAVLMLRTSPLLGTIVIVGMPLTAWIVTLVIKPLQSRQSLQREAQSDVTTITTDTVAGLRILRGIGGEEVFADRYRRASQELRRRGVQVAGTQSILMSLQVLLPGLFVAAIVWAAARLAIEGEITAGELVTFYGYTAYLSWPLMVFSSSVQEYTRAVVGVRRLRRLLETAPSAGSVAERERLEEDIRSTEPITGELRDTASGARFAPGLMTAIVAPDPDISAALATRLGRFDDGATPVTLDGTDLREMGLARARASIVVAGAEAQLFTGTLRQALAGRAAPDPIPVGPAELAVAEARRAGVADVDQQVRPQPRQADGDNRLLAALEAADANDVLTSLDAGLAGMITEKGRSLSGGQRQRVALARALLTEAPALVLISPTSALDSHTEARVAQRIRSARAGRTTVVVTESPLVLAACDEVVLLDGEGRERARATHRELLSRAGAGDEAALAYRRIVARATGAEGAPAPPVAAGAAGEHGERDEEAAH